MKLYNTEDGKQLKNRLKQDPTQRVTISYYTYHPIKNPVFFRDHLYVNYDKLEVKGRVYIAHEGVNAQISVPNKNLDRFLDLHEGISFLDGLRLNKAVEDDGKSFFKLKIQVKAKIVADGISDPEFNPSDTGTYLSAENFNLLIEKEDTVLIYMRNHYESEVGHFKNAWTPDVDTFRESLPVIVDELKDKKEKTIVMYCTGGIRCEKASAYMKHKGFNDVYHLEGGIIEYTRQIKEQQLENKFLGKNFVFDERLGERIGTQVIAQCHQCGQACDTHTNCANSACHLLFIQCEHCKTQYHNCCSDTCKEVLSLPEEEQRAIRKGKKSRNNIFRKGRGDLPFMNNLNA